MFISEFVFNSLGTKESFTLENSGVTIETPAEAHGALSCLVHTNPSLFLDFIEEDECHIAPIVDCQLSENTIIHSTDTFLIKVPCCQDVDPSSVRVRQGNIYADHLKPFVALPFSSFFVKDHNIVIKTRGFSQFICTSCNLVCRGQGQAFVFGKMLEHTEVGPAVSVRLYTCSPLYTIEEYKEVKWPSVLQLEAHTDK